MSKPTPLSTALDGLTDELAAQRRQREAAARSHREVGIEAERHPLHHIAPRGHLSLLVRVPGWERMFTWIEDPPLDGDDVLACPCGGRPELRDSMLVRCSCHRLFVLSRGAVFVTYTAAEGE